MKYSLFTFFILFSVLLKAQTSQTFNSSGTYVVPCGITSITVQCWGGGGAGGGARSNNNAAGGGGAGGAYAYSVIGVTAGQTITYTVGAGGVGSNNDGTAGGNTSFGGVVAVGGAGGLGSNTSGVSASGATASSAGSVGSIINAGGNGGTGSGGTSSGGGGGGAGTTANGGSGVLNAAGAGGITGGGNGGAGVTSGNPGSNGSSPGGGGGGARRTGGNSAAGGNGGSGQIIISYTGTAFSGNAGVDQSINLCTTNSLALSGNTVATTTGSWTCVSGCTGVSITTPTLATTSVTGLSAAGNIILRWTLSGSGCSSPDDMQITVNNTPGFTANAGADQTIVSCSTTTASITGNTVTGTSGRWTCVSGCGGVSISTPTAATTNITGLSFNNLTTFRWMLSSTTNTNCISVDNMIVVINCAATNDNPCSATAVNVNAAPICTVSTDGTVLGSSTSTLSNGCGGTADDDVWYSFVANSTSQDISLTNIFGSTTDLYHSVYQGGSCSTLSTTALSCSDPNNSTVSSLTVGVTYYVRVYSQTSTGGQNTVFELCVKPTPPAPTNTSCAVQQPICSDTPISFQAQNSGGAAAAGPNYGCLSTRPNPTWFYLEIANSGIVAIDITANSDIDFALWGPYPSLAAAQSSCTSYPAPLDCSYSSSNVEQANITGATSGQVYVLLVTNYAGVIQTINLTNAGTSIGSTNCTIVPVPLPIELVNFEVTLNESKYAILNWSTATETNNDYFEIQRSNNAYSWATIGTQKGAGNSVTLKNYQFIDKEPFKTISYYRLKQVDIDKTFAYSKIVSVDISSLPESISNLHPNPAKEQVNFDWKAPRQGNILIELLNSKGEDVYQNVKLIDEGVNNLTLDLNDYRSGVYLLKVTSESTGKSSMYKILKL